MGCSSSKPDEKAITLHKQDEKGITHQSETVTKNKIEYGPTPSVTPSQSKSLGNPS